ncbi:helix-loop-helix DNA-binding domain-containing transcription factor [Gigaspora margarita]|uniref:Helix-loop-helix DNA-binding domain-containing transcription factor n=1 Tax=Gigaspora margarita TaxID=4874 RepID=A0A8H4AGQ4_GIGMA|nr:helix-loop-helix DNA-binding domain-containing transcription factor [Gigaspora margarita]
MSESNPLFNESTNFQDLLMSESYIDDIMTSINNNLSTTQSSTVTLSEFETQIQEMFVDDNTTNSSSSRSGDLSLNDFQYPIPSLNSQKPFLYLPNSTSFDNSFPESLHNSLNSLNSLNPLNSLNSLYSSKNSMEAQEPFLFSSNSVNIGPSEPLLYSPISSEESIEDNSFPDNISPLTYTFFQDLNVPLNNSALVDFGSYSPIEDTFDTYNTQLSPDSNLDTRGIQLENGRKHVGIEYDSISFDESLKKKRKDTNGTVKSVKKTKKNNSSIKHETNSNISATLNEDSLTSNTRSKSPVIDKNIINAILAALSDTTNRTIESSDTKLVKNKHSNEDNTSLNESSLSNSKLSPKPSTTTSETQTNQKTIINQQKNKAHNVIERRYRNNINERINELKSVVPALCHLKTNDDDVIEEVDGIPAATKTNKATVLNKATEYIIHLKKKNLKLKNENTVLKKIIADVPCGIEFLKKIEREMETPPDTPISEVDPSYIPYQHKSLTPPGNSGSRILMSLFLCMTFLTDLSKCVQSVSHHHHDEGRVIASNNNESLVQSEIHSGITIEIWYFVRIITFLMCFTYIIRPSLFSIKAQHNRKPVTISCLTSKTKDVTELHSFLSSFTNISSMNTLGFAVGLFIESLRLFLRGFFGWEIFCGYANVDMDRDERLLEIELWNRLGEAELCGGNKHTTRFSILYTCLRTINLLENPYAYNRNMRINPSRIYANAALQCYVGLCSIPFLRHRALSHFWKLAIKEKRFFSSEEKWLELALANDQNDDMLINVANRIRDHVFHSFKPTISTTIPLVYVSEVQALFHIKEAFYNVISERHDIIKIQKKSQFTFSELYDITTPTSLIHWYALIGCVVQAFYEEKNDLGKRLVNKLKEESKTDNNLNKQIMLMSLISQSLLICGKIEASIHCADKAINYVSLRKNEQMEISEIEKDFMIRDIVKDVQDLAEFCVGWMVLETRIIILGIIGNLLSKNKVKILPNVLDEKHLRTSIDILARYLRRSTKSNAFDSIPKLRERFIRKLDAVGRIVSGIDEDNDSGRDCNDKQYNNEYKATRALCILKDIKTQEIRSSYISFD